MATISSNGALPAYAELQCLSNFSFLKGASRPEELLARAAQLGYSALAIADECSLAGVVRAHVAAKEIGLKLLIGSQFVLSDPDGTPSFSLLVLAQNRNGYGNLSELITIARTRIAKGSYRLMPDDLAAPPADYAHLRGLPDCLVVGMSLARTERPVVMLSDAVHVVAITDVGQGVGCCRHTEIEGGKGPVLAELTIHAAELPVRNFAHRSLHSGRLHFA